MLDHITSARKVLEIEQSAIANIASNLNTQFAQSIDEIIASDGRLVVTGMGKSGLIGKKISATLASTGTPSFFLHPAEAFHGDLGMVVRGDMILSLSNSGETDEILKILPYIKELGCRHISITGNLESTLAKQSDIALFAGVDQEACPLQLAPTASTTAALAMGDAIAVAVMTARNFQAENFARFHPGGSLGKRLLLKACDLMRTNDLPTVQANSPAVEAIHKIGAGRLGLVVVTDEGDSVCGVITDGDLRRALDQNGSAFFEIPASQIMTPHPKSVTPFTSYSELEEIFTMNKIASILVVENDRLNGVVQVYDL